MQGAVGRVGREQGIVLAQGITRVTGIRVLAGTLHHAGTYRIEFDVPLAGEQITVVLYQAGVVPALPQGAGAPVQSVDGLHVLATQGLHDAGDGGGPGGRDQQVHVVGHQHVGVDVALVPARGGRQYLQVEVVVGGLKEHGLLVHAAHEHMLGHVGNEQSWFTRHGDTVTGRSPCGQGNKLRFDPD